MPASIVAAPLIGAGASIIGGIMGSRASNKAADAQERSTQQALDYQRGRDAKAEKYFQQQYEQSMAGRRALLKRYGLTVPEWDPQGPPPGAVPRGGPQGAPQGRPANIAQLAGGEGTPQERAIRLKGRDPRTWDEWGRYGLGDG